MKKVAGKKRASTREPTAASLMEIPEIAPDAVSYGRGPKALQRALADMRIRRGRPKAGEQAGGSSPRSVRLPDATWAALESRAKQQGTTVHALLRQAVAKLLKATAA